MKIGIYAPGCFPDAPLYTSTRGEGRWGLNWCHILNRYGHQARIIYDDTLPDGNFDLYLEGSYSPKLCIPEVPHIHLYYGVPMSLETLNQFNCYRAGNCTLGFGYYHDYQIYQKHAHKIQYLGVPLPIPFSDSMLPTPRVPSDQRTEIAWAAKEIWHRELGIRSPHIPRTGTYFLQALADLNQTIDFTFNLVQPLEEGTDINQATPDALEAFRRLKSVQVINYPSFRTILEVMSRSRLSLSVAGMMSSAVDAIFCGCVPVVHNTMAFSDSVRGIGGCLPASDTITKDEIYYLVKKLYTDTDFYLQVYDGFQRAFDPHREENCITYFNETTKKMGLTS